MRYSTLLALIFLLSACNLGQAVLNEEIQDTNLVHSEQLVIAWVDSGNLIIWQTGDSLPRRVSSGGVVAPFVAPDGQHIAFTRGAQSNAETLWVVDVAGTAEQQLVGERPTDYIPGENQIGDVVWLDERTVYFTTLQQQAPFYEPENNLYSVDILTHELALIAVPSDGGRISMSPDSQNIVTVYHGTYGHGDGMIRLMDLLGRADPDNLLFFDGVSTASEFRFYPNVYWMPDSSAILLAIPDPDLIYSDSAETTLWQIPLDNPSGRGIIGTVQASFFGLPQWSYDGSTMTYLQRTDETNQFTAFIAEGNGDNPLAIFSGSVGEIEAPNWLPKSNRFVFARPIADGGGTRNYFLGGVGLESVPLSNDPIFSIEFLSDRHYVAVTQGNRRLDMRFNEIGGESQFIGSLNTVPIFDAVYVD